MGGRARADPRCGRPAYPIGEGRCRVPRRRPRPSRQARGGNGRAAPPRSSGGMIPPVVARPPARAAAGATLTGSSSVRGAAAHQRPLPLFFRPVRGGGGAGSPHPPYQPPPPPPSRAAGLATTTAQWGQNRVPTFSCTAAFATPVGGSAYVCRPSRPREGRLALKRRKRNEQPRY